MTTRLDPTAMNWDDLHLFLAAYRARSLTGAGKTLGLDQSTASRRLASLEKALKARLFDRVPGGLAPTGLAERVLPIAETAEGAAAAFVREAEAADEAVEGVVRLAVPDGIDSEFLVPLLPKLLAQYPGLVIELVASQQVANLARREADLALRLVRPRTGDLVARKVAVLAQGVWVHPWLGFGVWPRSGRCAMGRLGRECWLRDYPVVSTCCTQCAGSVAHQSHRRAGRRRGGRAGRGDPARCLDAATQRGPGRAAAQAAGRRRGAGLWRVAGGALGAGECAASAGGVAVLARTSGSVLGRPGRRADLGVVASRSV